MGLDAISLSLTLNDAQYKKSLDDSHQSLKKLDNVKMSGVQRGIKGATSQLKAMEKQAKRTKSELGHGLLGTMDRVSQTLGKIGRLSRAVGLGMFGIGGIAKLSGMWMGRKSKVEPGSSGAAKVAARQARGKRMSDLGSKIMGIGGKFSMAGWASSLAGGIVGTIPGIAKLLGASKSASGGVGELTSKLTGLSGAANKAGGSSSRLGGVLNVLTSGITAAAVGAGALAVGIGAVAVSGLNMNSRLERAKAQFEVFTGSAVKADAIIEELKKRADITPFDTQAYIEGGTALMSAAKGSKKELMGLMKTAEMLTVLKPEQGLAGAAYALKEAMGGQFTSLQSRFDISPSTIKKYKELGLSGQELVRAVLSEMNITEKSIDKLGTTFEARKSTLFSFIDNIRMALSGGLFSFLSERMGAAIAWIDTNQQWVIDTASGIGTMIGNVVSQVGAWISSTWQTVAVLGNTLWQFFGNLPGKIAASFQDGTLISGIIDLASSAMVGVWNTVKFLGKTLWDGIVNGVPLLTAIVGKLAIDGLRHTLGDKISGMLGLDKLSTTLGDATSGGAIIMKDNFKANLGEYMAEQRGALSAAGDAGRGLANTLGWGEAKAAAVAGGGPDFGIRARLQQAQLNGQQARLQKEREISQVQWNDSRQAPVTPIPRPQANPQQLQMMEKFNARAQMRPAQRVDVRFTSMDGAINPLSR